LVPILLRLEHLSIASNGFHGRIPRPVETKPKVINPQFPEAKLADEVQGVGHGRSSFFFANS
jgi:hypothetical protein